MYKKIAALFTYTSNLAIFNAFKPFNSSKELLFIYSFWQNISKQNYKVRDRKDSLFQAMILR